LGERKENKIEGKKREQEPKRNTRKRLKSNFSNHNKTPCPPFSFKPSESVLIKKTG